MESTGIARKIDSIGRVVLPIGLRNNLNLSEGDSLEIYVDGDSIVLKKHLVGCCICHSTNSKEISGVRLCPQCAEKFLGGNGNE